MGSFWKTKRPLSFRVSGPDFLISAFLLILQSQGHPRQRVMRVMMVMAVVTMNLHRLQLKGAKVSGQ
jgi:hypothetical protein